jgi:hypothetical protein
MANLALALPGRTSFGMGMPRNFNPGATGSRALATIRSAGGKLGGVVQKAGLAIRQNGAIRAAVANGDAQSLGSVATEAAPELGTNLLASAADETELGKSITEAIGVKPSTIALAVTSATMLLLPKSKRGMRSKVAKVGIGLAHVVLGGLGRRLPGALSAGSLASKFTKDTKTAGTTGDAGATGDAKPVPGEATES